MVAKRLFLTFLSLILGSGLAHASHRILAIQSFRVQPYEQALRGFMSVCQADIKRVVLSEPERGGVAEIIDETQPDLILAIGADALSRVRHIKDIPIVYMMVLNPHALVTRGGNVTGVSMNISQEAQLSVLSEILPHARNVGLLYDPKRTGYLVRQAERAAQKTLFSLTIRKISRSKDVPTVLMGIKDDIDVFWMLPDITLVTPETVESMVLFSLENKIPILTFSKKYLELGAFISIGIDPLDIGIQAGEMANRILRDDNRTQPRPVDARKAVVYINSRIAKKLGIALDEQVVQKFRVIR